MNESFDAPSGFRLLKPLRLGLGRETWIARYSGRKVVARRYSGTERRPAMGPRPDGRLLRRLAHPNIQRYVASFRDADGDTFVVFRWYEGDSLRDICRGDGLKPGMLAGPLLDASRALRWIHRRSPVAPRVHGDVSPGNILVQESGRVRLIDGLYLTPGTYPVSRGTILGTLPYLSPEVLDGEPPREPSDVFSLGVSCLWASLGGLPWSGARKPSSVLRRMKDAQPSALASRTRGFGLEQREVLAAMVEWEPARRPSAAEVCALVFRSATR